MPFDLIKSHVSLRPLNSFGLDVKARFLAEAKSVLGLTQILEKADSLDLPKLIIGGGSNVLFTKDYPGLVLLNRIKGLDLVEETNHTQVVRAGAGENWHDYVMNMVERGLGGVENLSLIPGTIGAAPMQNIGAYGVEIKEVFKELSAIDLQTLEMKTFDKEACQFGYRTSIFKTTNRNRFFITSVTLELQRTPQLNLTYTGVQEMIEKMNPDRLNVKTVSQAVIAIRREKLPDPAEIGNAGSFFKNPVVDELDYEGLVAEFENIPGYHLGGGKVKIPAAWLIDQCGWKGKQFGSIGVHPRQPLVLVNYGGGTGDQLVQLSIDIRNSVADKFGINLEPEVNVIQ